MAQAVLSIGVALIPGLGPVASAVLGVAAGLIGGMIDQALFAKKVKGPALPDLSVPGASPGDPINVMAGKARVTGAYAWMKTRTETRTEGGKGIGGGASVETKVRYLSALVVWGERLGGGACTRIEKIFADRELAWEYVEPIPDIISSDVTLTVFAGPFFIPGRTVVWSTLSGPEATLAPYATLGARFAVSGTGDITSDATFEVRDVETSAGTTTLGTWRLPTPPHGLEEDVTFGPGVEITISNASANVGTGGRPITLRHYLGAEDQTADPYIVAADGDASAFRGLCCSVVEDLDLTPWGGRLPVLEALVDAGTVTASQAIVAAAKAAGVPESRIIVDITGTDPPLAGYITRGPAAAREVIDAVALVADLQVDDCGDRLLIRDRLRPIDASVDRSQLGTTADGQPAAPLPIDMRRDADLPSEMAVRYLDPTRDYQQALATSPRIPGRGGGTAVVDLPIALTADDARSLAERLARQAWHGREEARATLPLPYVLVEPGDILDLGDARPRWRVVSRNLAGAVVALALIADQDDSDIGGALGDTGGGGPQDGPQPPSPVALYLLDLPPLSETDGALRWYAAAVPQGPRWAARSLVQGDSTVLASLPLPATGGAALTVLPPGPEHYFDRVSTVDVWLPSGSLSSVTEAALLASTTVNAFLVGAEIVRATTCTLVAANTWRLSGLLRGQRGTENEISNHVVGDVVILLDGALVSVSAASSEIGILRTWRAVPAGGVVADYPAIEATLTGEVLRPFAPAHLQGVRDADTGGWALSWVRVSRLSPTWPVEDVPLPADETPERYRVSVLDGDGAVVRTYNRSVPSVTYTAAQQTTDFGAPQTTIRVRVQQISPTVGLGHQREAILT